MNSEIPSQYLEKADGGLNNPQRRKTLSSLKISWPRLVFRILLGSCAVFLTYWYLKTPLSIDLPVSLGATKQAMLAGGTVSSIIESYDLRGLLYKVLMMALHVMVESYGYDGVFDYELKFKLIFLLFSLGPLWIIARMWRKVRGKSSLTDTEVLLIAFIAFYSISNSWIQIQPEAVAALLGLAGATMVYGSRNPLIRGLGYGVLSSTFFSRE